MLATTIQLSSLTTRAGGGALALVVAVARVGALAMGVGVLAPVVGVVATVLEVGVGDGALAPVVGVAVAGGVFPTWIFSNPHRSNPVSPTTLDTDSVGLLQELPPPRFSGTLSTHDPTTHKGRRRHSTQCWGHADDSISRVPDHTPHS